MTQTTAGWFAVLTAGLLPSALAAAEIKLAHHPDYHNGKIVFSYLGDLWTVNEDGSQPVRLTVHAARDTFPRFSPDGKWIAFSSNRYGNNDVFLMPAEGGRARQLTFHSADDRVVGWSRDGQRILFSSARGQPYPGIPNLYEVPRDGGLERMLPTDWGVHGHYSLDGKKLAFNRHPIPWSRKHYRGSYAADLWVLDVETTSFRRILDNDLPDNMKPNNLWPMFGPDGFIYFVSDRDVMAPASTGGQVMTSTNNIWKVPEYGGQPIQVTRHTSGNLYFPSMSADGKVIVYEENFGLWKLDTATGQTQEIKIHIASDDRDNMVEVVTVNGEADAFSLSPSGKRAVITTRGELFTIATDRGDVRRLTTTSSVREGQPQWSPDGKWIAFFSDQSGRDEVWICNEFGKEMKQVSQGDSQKVALQWSPDSKHLLYTASDKKLHKYTLATGQTKVLATGDSFGFGGAAIMGPQWSPDGRYIAYAKMDSNLQPHIYIVPSDGGEERRVTDPDFYNDSSPLWTPDGKKLVFLSGTETGMIGGGNRPSTQIYVVSLVREEKDSTDRGIDSEAEAVEKEREQRQELRRRFTRPGAEGDDDGDQAAAARAVGQPARVEVKIDFDRIGRRVRQLTRVGDTIGTMAVAPDSRSLVFTTSGTEGGRPVMSLWQIGLDGERLTRLMQSGTPTSEGDESPRQRGMFGGGFSQLQFTRDGRSLYYRQGDGIYVISIPPLPTGDSGAAAAASRPSDGSSPLAAALASRAGSGSATPRRLNFTARVEVDHRQVYRQVFNESWRVMKHRFYDPAMHGVDWAKVKATYEPLLEHVGDQEELHNVVNMMLGELNASHTGISGGGRQGREDRALATRFPGFDLVTDSSGFYKVGHIYKNGPADKDYVKLEVGQFVLAVDDHELKSGDNYWQHFTKAPGARLEFTVNSKPTREGAWKVKITPVSSMQMANLQYEKWVADCRRLVDKLSGGTIGYLHIRQMNEPALRQFERDLTANATKQALIIDQRFNPGGNIDQELLQILQQKQYQYTRVRDSSQLPRPLRGFFGPMVVLQNERSTSDAEVFPDGFKTLKLGKVVGVTTYGAVIGTGAYQLMDGSTIRTPSSGLWNVRGENLENLGVPPDVYVDNTPEDALKGRDAQLIKAVEVLKEELRERKK